MTLPSRVIKVGGSLLEWPPLATSFRRWLSLEPPAANVVVVGGGRIVDILRTIDRAQRLSPEISHWLAIRAMSLTAALFSEILCEATLVHTLEELGPSSAQGMHVFDVERFMREDAGGDDALRCTWDVTSDSIAARVAKQIDAAELVLLKSALPAEQASREALARSGYVDQCFPQAAQELNVRCVNLRQDEFPQLVV